MRFYTTVLAPLGGGAGGWAVTQGAPTAQRLHVGFFAASPEHVDAFWEAGTAAGYRDDGAPGPRPQYREEYYGGFLLDPDGNSVEAVHHGASNRVAGQVDHLWLRVSDLAAARDEHRPACEAAGFALAHDGPERVQFSEAGASFSLVEGEPTRHADLGFLAIS